MLWQRDWEAIKLHTHGPSSILRYFYKVFMRHYYCYSAKFLLALFWYKKVWAFYLILIISCLSWSYFFSIDRFSFPFLRIWTGLMYWIVQWWINANKQRSLHCFRLPEIFLRELDYYRVKCVPIYAECLQLSCFFLTRVVFFNYFAS